MSGESGRSWLGLLLNLAPIAIVFLATIWLTLRRRKKKAQAVSHAPVTNLLPLTDYLAETGYWQRLPILCGVMFALFMGSGVFVITTNTPNLMYSPIVSSMVGGLFGGLFFGVFFTFFTRRRFNNYLACFYKGEGWIANPPPEDLHAIFQVPGARVDSGLNAGGLLYVGPEALAFVPQKLNRRQVAPVTLAPISSLSFELADPPKGNGLQRFLIPRPQPHLLISGEAIQLRLIIPQPSVVLERLKRGF